jgi:uncharacterized phage protein (TIGR01671 family)
MYEVSSIYWYDQPDEDGHTGEVFFKGQPSTEYIEDVTLKQCTGLKDKNGREIYEGDVMREPNYEPEIYGEYSYYEVSHGDTGDARWGWYLRGYAAASSIKTFESLEVCRNIYENPELMAAKQ